MAFNMKGLQKIGDGAPFADGEMPKTFWHYTSPDAQTVIRVANYFLPAINLIKAQDLLWITAANGGTPLHYLAYCNSNTGTAIDITDGDQVAAADTD